MLTCKVCSKCSLVFPISFFTRRKDSPDGYRNDCKKCRSKQHLQWSSKNREKINKRQRENYPKYKDKILKRQKEYYSQNRERKLAIGRKSYIKNITKRKASNKRNYQNNKKEYYARSAQRRVLKLQATPSWLTNRQLEDIKEIYRDAYNCRWLNEEPLHVDHIVPVNSELVCGLHVSWNLQILTASENLKKSNKVEKCPMK